MPRERDWLAAFRRERRVLARAQRSRWRLKQAETERAWARVEGDVVVNLARVGAILRRIACDIEELARARRIDDLQGAAVKDDSRAERRRLAEPDLTFAEFCDRTGTPWRSTHHDEQAWTSYQIERHRRGETDQDPFDAYDPGACVQRTERLTGATVRMTPG